MELKKIKLNKLANRNLAEREMKTLKGGCHLCRCSCAYANQGGSSVKDNRAANYNMGDGTYSKTGDNSYELGVCFDDNCGW